MSAEKKVLQHCRDCRYWTDTCTNERYKGQLTEGPDDTECLYFKPKHRT